MIWLTISAMPLLLMKPTSVKFRAMSFAPSRSAVRVTAASRSAPLPSSSPRRSITGTPPTTRTLASSSLLLISLTFPMHHQFQAMVVLTICDVQLVNHFFHEEQAPPARRLLPGQLRIDVGRGRADNRPALAVIDDPHDDRVRPGVHPHKDRPLRPVPVAMLDGVQRPLGDRCL